MNKHFVNKLAFPNKPCSKQSEALPDLFSRVPLSVKKEEPKKEEPKPENFFRISSGEIGVFQVKGNPGKPNFLTGYAGIFAGISQRFPKLLRRIICVQFSFLIFFF